MGLVTGDGLKLSHSASCQCGLVIWREGRHPWKAAVAKLACQRGGSRSREESREATGGRPRETPGALPVPAADPGQAQPLLFSSSTMTGWTRVLPPLFSRRTPSCVGWCPGVVGSGALFIRKRQQPSQVLPEPGAESPTIVSGYCCISCNS